MNDDTTPEKAPSDSLSAARNPGAQHTPQQGLQCCACRLQEREWVDDPAGPRPSLERPKETQ